MTEIILQPYEQDSVCRKYMTTDKPPVKGMVVLQAFDADVITSDVWFSAGNIETRGAYAIRPERISDDPTIIDLIQKGLAEIEVRREQLIESLDYEQAIPDTYVSMAPTVPHMGGIYRSL